MRRCADDRLPRAEAPSRAAVATLAVLSFATLPAAPLSAQRAAHATRAAPSTHLLVVTGLGGEAAYTARFREWGSRLVAAVRAGGAASVVWLAERPDLHPAVTGVSRRDDVAAAVAAVAERALASDQVVLALFGHGSERDGEARVNLPGPDLTAGDLATWLAPLAPRRVVVVNAASASGGFLAPLSAPGRVVITATRSAREAQAPRFGGHFVDALAGDAADADKDGRISMLEAFEYARREVAREFEAANALATEHPLLDDDGDGAGSLEAGGADGDLAAMVTLAAGAAATASGRPAAGADPADDAAPTAEPASADPALRALLAEKARLEAALASLRAREDRLPVAEYRAELERLLLAIARNGRAIREHQDG